MKIHCCGCGKKVDARLTDGEEIYPHLSDLRKNPFWKCDACGNYVGTHNKTGNPTKPLGVIPTPELRKVRQRIHRMVDELWREGFLTRKEAYREMSRYTGRRYHTADIASMDEAEKALEAAGKLRNSCMLSHIEEHKDG